MRQRPAVALTIVPAVVALGLLLAGCTVTFRPGTSSSASVRGSGVIVWAQLGLHLDLPGVVIIERHSGPHRSDSVFDSNDSLDGVYRDVDGRMRAQGWHRDHHEEHHGKIVAVYVRNGQVVHVTVIEDGHHGRYRLTIDD